LFRTDYVGFHADITLGVSDRRNHCVEKIVAFDEKPERAPALAEFGNADGGTCSCTWRRCSTLHRPALCFVGEAHRSRLALPDVACNFSGAGVQQAQCAANAGREGKKHERCHRRFPS